MMATKQLEQLRGALQHEYNRGRDDGYQAGLIDGYQRGRDEADTDYEEALATLLIEIRGDASNEVQARSEPKLTSQQQQALEWLNRNQPQTYSSAKKAGWGRSTFYKLRDLGVVRHENGQFFVKDN